MTNYPEVSEAVDHHGPLDEFIGTLEQVLPRNHAGVVDEQVHVSDLAANALCGGVHTLAVPHITHVRVDLRFERLHLRSTTYTHTHSLVRTRHETGDATNGYGLLLCY